MTDETYTDRVLAWASELPRAVCEYPFGPQVAVFKIGGKMFALVALDGPGESVTVKIDPEEGTALRDRYGFVREGYYMNKRHWITIDLGPDVPDAFVRDLLENSHSLVAVTLTKKARAGLGLGDG
jgi:predicted DNA-binding protein (MmcQ/YjbR family)